MGRFKEKIRAHLKVVCGVNKLREEIDSLYYILDHGMDIRNFPKATGALRNYQLADVELLRLFHEACQNYQLTYWLDWGTLLGAVRHNGFIPWDDDLDVAMPREDFDKAKPLLSEVFSTLGFTVLLRHAIYIYDGQSGVALDIFPVDQIEYGDMALLQKKANQLLAICTQKYEPQNYKNVDGLDEYRKQIMTSTPGKHIYYNALETSGKLYLHKPDDLFPLKLHTFEQYEFMVPHDPDAYAKVQYGEYMSFPRSGILHHVSDGNHTYLRSVKNHVDINEVTEKLSKIHIV